MRKPIKVKVYVEGGGDREDLRTECRRGFTKFSFRRSDMTIWSVLHEISLQYRPRINGGGRGQYGGLELITTHDPEARGVIVELLDPSHEAKQRFPDLVAGFEDYESERSNEGRPVGAVRLTITRVHSHPIDTNAPLMRRLAKEAVRRLFEQHGREIPVPYGDAGMK